VFDRGRERERERKGGVCVVTLYIEKEKGERACYALIYSQ
jgi:hypothetical protein